MNELQKPRAPATKKIWQKNWFKNLATVIIFLAVYIALRPFFQGDVIQGQAPQMQLKSINGQSIDLQELTAVGKPVLIHIWATWCPICNFSRDGIDEIAADYPVISIATQSQDTESLLKFVEKHQMNPSIIINDLDGKWMQAFGAKAVPADFIVNPDGEIEFVEVGYTTNLGLRIRLWLASL